MREISDALGLAEPSVRRIISQLISAGYVKKQLDRGVNHYSVTTSLPIKCPELNHVSIGALIQALNTAVESGFCCLAVAMALNYVYA